MLLIGLFGEGERPYKVDPTPDRRKVCQVEVAEPGRLTSPNGWGAGRFLARDGETWPNLSGPAAVRYGASGRWVYRYLPMGGNGQCGPAFFGNRNPAPDLIRHCEVVTSMGAGSTIAVLSTGTEDHPDLRGKWLDGLDMTAFPLGWAPPARLPERNRLKETTATWDSTLAGSRPCQPGYYPWQGVETAGIAAATAHNAIGTAGVAPFARLLPVVVKSCARTVSPEQFTFAIRWAAGETLGTYPEALPNPNPADVILVPEARPGPCWDGLQRAIDAARQRGAVVVAASGDAVSGPGQETSSAWPGNCRHVVTVTATDRSNQVLASANRGLGTRLAAPGSALYAPSMLTIRSGTRGPTGAILFDQAYADSKYAFVVDGTGGAAAVVAGIAALMKGKRRSLSAKNVEWRLGASGQRMCTGCGSGIVDAYRALRSAEAITEESDRNKTPATADYISAAADVQGRVVVAPRSVCVVEDQCGDPSVIAPTYTPDRDYFALHLRPGQFLSMGFEQGSCPACTFSVNGGTPMRLSDVYVKWNQTSVTQKLTIEVRGPLDPEAGGPFGYNLQTKY